jgi:hypothetical protein
VLPVEGCQERVRHVRLHVSGAGLRLAGAWDLRHCFGLLHLRAQHGEEAGVEGIAERDCVELARKPKEVELLQLPALWARTPCG